MKRNHVLASLALAALLASSPSSGFAQQLSETASTDIYDFSKFDEYKDKLAAVKVSQ